ncbi:MAG TPA: alkaline phosphatase D family protein [Nocardioidaceae bacterium]
MAAEPLVLGPLLRYVDQHSASVWVETRDSARVVVRAGERSWEGRTFRAHGHHYALVEVVDLEPGTVTAYSVEVDGIPAWPEPGSTYPPSVIATLQPGRRLRMAFGSCRTTASYDEAGDRLHGVDALRAYALDVAHGRSPRPDLVLFLGDQVYADETSAEMRGFIEARRDPDRPPGYELKDYEEYAHLYALAWSDEVNRWLLSTLPTAMIFDDHDVRDDWNTSLAWRQRMRSTAWWHGRIVAALASYWVYQHLGNLSPAERALDPLWQRVRAHDGPDELDLTEELDAFAAAADEESQTYRWSYHRDVGDVRLLVVDSRAARVLQPGRRDILDDVETSWLDEHLRGGFRHVLVATSLPFLLPVGLHHLEAWDEALVDGAWGGGPAARFGEWLRQAVDLEHWAAFQDGFRWVAELTLAVADGRRGPAPETVTFLSGDVHHSYVSEVSRGSRRTGGAGSRARVVQVVCSPLRNPLPRVMRFATAFLSYGLAGPMGALVARSAKVPNPPFRWKPVAGPWFDNNVAVLEDRPDGLAIRWDTGVVHDGDHARPVLEPVTSVLLRPDGGTEVRRQRGSTPYRRFICAAWWRAIRRSRSGPMRSLRGSGSRHSTPAQSLYSRHVRAITRRIRR